MALKAGLTTEEEVEMLKQNVADGYTSVEHSVEMWEDQLEKVGILKDARLKRERHLASEAARRLIGKRVDISQVGLGKFEFVAWGGTMRTPCV